MEDFDTKFDQLFEGITKTLIEDYRFNSKLVNDSVHRIKRFSAKADKAYFNLFKSSIDEFLDEEERIYDEISSNLNEDEEVGDSLLEIVSEIEEIINDTKMIVDQSRELSQGIDTINKRIQSYEKIQATMKNLKETIEKGKEIASMDNQQNAMIVDEM